MSIDKTMQHSLASYLLTQERMIVEATPEMMERFPLGTPDSDAAAWLRAAAKLLGAAVELRRSRASSPLTLVVKDRGELFVLAEAEAMEAMAKKRKEHN